MSTILETPWRMRVPSLLTGLVGSQLRLLMQPHERRMADPHQPLCFLGPPGSGKELCIAEAHRLSGRPGLLISHNCANSELNEATFLGHVPGAFTDAKKGAPGLVEQADGGTLFLDEVHELANRPELLNRILETREVRRLGATVTRQVDVRVLVASSRTACELHENLGPALFSRLGNVVRVPPLHEHSADVPELVAHFSRLFARQRGKDRCRIPSFTPALLADLERYDWPLANVRDLRTYVEYALSGCDWSAGDAPIDRKTFFDWRRTRPEPKVASRGSSLARSSKSTEYTLSKDPVLGLLEQAATLPDIEAVLYRRYKAGSNPPGFANPWRAKHGVAQGGALSKSELREIASELNSLVAGGTRGDVAFLRFIGDLGRVSARKLKELERERLDPDGKEGAPRLSGTFPAFRDPPFYDLPSLIEALERVLASVSSPALAASVAAVQEQLAKLGAALRAEARPNTRGI